MPTDKGLIQIDIDSEAVTQMLDRVKRATGDLTKLMVGVRQELLAQAESNFASQGRPPWPALSQSTKDARAKKDKWPGSILQVSGTLARSMVIESDEQSARIGVGSEVPYAAIHQLGGKAGRGHKTVIAPRPYLPMIDGALQPQAEEAILEIVQDYLKQAVNNEIEN